MIPRGLCIAGTALIAMAMLLLVPLAAMANYTVRMPDGSVSDVEPFPLAGTAAAFYSYNAPNRASSHTGLEQSNNLVLMLVQQSDGTIALVALADDVDDGTGGKLSLSMQVSPWQTGLDFILKDDPHDQMTVDASAGTAHARFTWDPCCTDGFVFGPLSGNDWKLSLALDLALPLAGIDSVVVLTQGARGVVIDLALPVKKMGSGPIVFSANSPPTAAIAPQHALHTGDVVTLERAARIPMATR